MGEREREREREEGIERMNERTVEQSRVEETASRVVAQPHTYCNLALGRGGEKEK